MISWTSPRLSSSSRYSGTRSSSSMIAAQPRRSAMVSNSGMMFMDSRGACAGMQQARFLQQQRDLQHVAHAVGVGDDVVGQRARPIAPLQLRRGVQDPQLAGRVARRMSDAASAAAWASPALPAASAAAPLPRARDSRGGWRRAANSSATTCSVHPAVLAHVERREVKTEHLRRAHQAAQPAGREPPGAGCAASESRDDLEVAHELLRLGVGLRRRDLGEHRGMLVERARGGREPRVDPGQRAPVGFVTPVLGLVRRARGQLLELRSHLHHAQRLRQLAAELVHLARGRSRARWRTGGPARAASRRG